VSEAIKFPKTPRLAAVMGEDHHAWRAWQATVEEKVDGANAGIWFEGEDIRLQSRGHILRGGGGAGERQFAAFHGWAARRLDQLREALGWRFVLYGEWCFAKHKAYYDALPDWLVGYDVLDRETGRFLGVSARDEVLASCLVTAVPRVWQGAFGKAPAFGLLIGPSRLKTSKWRDALAREGAKAGVRDPMSETDDSDAMEGIYVRIEDAGGIVGRMKVHRTGFEKVRSDHWRQRPLIRNTLAA
jgi:hypothetical protein